jgi:hypothetical protein
MPKSPLIPPCEFSWPSLSYHGMALVVNGPAAKVISAQAGRLPFSRIRLSCVCPSGPSGSPNCPLQFLTGLLGRQTLHYAASAACATSGGAQPRIVRSTIPHEAEAGVDAGAWRQEAQAAASYLGVQQRCHRHWKFGTNVQKSLCCYHLWFRTTLSIKQPNNPIMTLAIVL